MITHSCVTCLVLAVLSTTSAAQAPPAGAPTPQPAPQAPQTPPLFTLDADAGGTPITLTHDDTVFRTDAVFRGTAAADATVEIVSFDAKVGLLDHLQAR
jgi:hypothetical protein